MDAVKEDMQAVGVMGEDSEDRATEQSGDGRSAVATPDGSSQKKKKK